MDDKPPRRSSRINLGVPNPFLQEHFQMDRPKRARESVDKDKGVLGNNDNNALSDKSGDEPDRKRQKNDVTNTPDSQRRYSLRSRLSESSPVSQPESATKRSTPDSYKQHNLRSRLTGSSPVSQPEPLIKHETPDSQRQHNLRSRLTGLSPASQPEPSTKKSIPDFQKQHHLRSRLTGLPETPQQATPGPASRITPNSERRDSLRPRPGGSFQAPQQKSSAQASQSTPEFERRRSLRNRPAIAPQTIKKESSGPAQRSNERPSRSVNTFGTKPAAPKPVAPKPAAPKVSATKVSTPKPPVTKQTAPKPTAPKPPVAEPPVAEPSQPTSQASIKMEAPQPQVARAGPPRQRLVADPSTVCRICSAQFADARELRFCRWLAWRICTQCWGTYGRSRGFGPGAWDDKVIARKAEMDELKVKMKAPSAGGTQIGDNTNKATDIGSEIAHGDNGENTSLLPIPQLASDSEIPSSDPPDFDPNYVLQSPRFPPIPQLPEFDPNGIFPRYEYPSLTAFQRLPYYGPSQAFRVPETPPVAGPSGSGSNQTYEPPQSASARRSSFLDLNQAFRIHEYTHPRQIPVSAPEQMFNGGPAMSAPVETNGGPSRNPTRPVMDALDTRPEVALSYHRQSISALLQSPTNLASLSIEQDDDVMIVEQENSAREALDAILYSREHD
ncbi:hypothetical protein G7Z17_g6598 [Cylindrodendrum hubeiense]|uniref:Uncharacterized protein n=1 Tax=Cylindrodendrum hubeiense TaxID=595255 RepID=A0A9P5HC04_9HYPO|nr:hypothetical protein G7Z17_g6598 [Cylindrodendrum hubeiense]